MFSFKKHQSPKTGKPKTRRVVILGAGQVGIHIMERLAAEKYDVLLIDESESVIAEVRNRADVATIQGNGCDPEIYIEIELEESDLFLAVTDSDETNLVACNIAHAFGCKTKIARVRQPFYRNYPDSPIGEQFWQNLGVDVLFNQDRLTTEEIVNLVNNPGARDAVYIHKDEVQILSYQVKAGSLLCGRRLVGLRDVARFANILVAAVTTTESADKNNSRVPGKYSDSREVTIIPRGDYRIRENDILYLCGKKNDFEGIGQLFNPRLVTKVKYIFILGGSILAGQLAEALLRHYRNSKIHIIERNKKNAFMAGDTLNPKINILLTDVHDIETLRNEGLDDQCVYIGASPNEDDNVLACLMVKEETGARTIAIVQNTTYMHLFPYLAIDAAVSPKLLLIDDVLKALRRNVYDVLSAKGNNTEVLEFIVEPDSILADKELREIKFPAGAIIVSVIRGEEVLIPRGLTSIFEGDHLIIFCLLSSLEKIQELFQEKRR